MKARVLLAVCLGCALFADVLDRIAVSVGNSVITESELRHQLQVRAFVEGVPLVLDEEAKRAAADRMIEQTLIRREMQSARYAPPEAAQARLLVDNLKQTRFNGDDAAWRRELERTGLGEADLEAAFLWQLTVLRFIEFRFRPGIQIPTEEIREQYEQKFLPRWKARTADPPPSYEQAERECENELVQERIDNQLDRWISQTRTQTNIRYRDDVLRSAPKPETRLAGQ